MYGPETTQLPGVVTGRITGVADDGRPLVSIGDGAPAEASVVWMRPVPSWDRCVGLRVAVALLEDEAGCPLVLGLLEAPPEEAAMPETLRVESRKELVIECGKAKIALRSDGRIEIRGGHVISRSTGPNKIKGGTVHIN